MAGGAGGGPSTWHPQGLVANAEPDSAHLRKHREVFEWNCNVCAGRGTVVLSQWCVIMQ